MRYCRECGTGLSDQAKFCRECGTGTDTQAGIEALEARNVQASEGEQEAQYARAEVASASPAPAKGLSRKQKWFAGLAVLLVVLLFGTYKAGEYYASPERLVTRFEKALASEDAAQTADLLTSKDPKLVLDEKSITALMAYLKQHPEEQDFLLSGLKEQAEAAKNKEMSVEPLDGILNLEKDGKMLMFDTYRLDLEPVYFKLQTNFADTVLTVNGKQAAVSDNANFEVEAGPYVPGVYTVGAQLKNDYINLNETVETEVWEPDRTRTVDLELDGEMVVWDTGFREELELEGRIYINGKKIDVNPFETDRFGPVPLDGSVKLTLEGDFPWGTMKSGEQAIDEDYLVFDFTRQQEFQEMMITRLSQHAKENMEAFVTGDMTKYSGVTKDYTDAMLEVIAQFVNSDYAYTSKYSGTIFDIGSFRLVFEEGEWRAAVVLQPMLEAASYPEGETPQLEVQDNYSRTILVYSEKLNKWLIASDSTAWGFETDQLEEVREPSPILYKSQWKSNSEVLQDTDAEDTAVTLTTLQSFMKEYTESYVEAVNSGKFDKVKTLLDPSGPAYQETSDYIQYLNKKGITEKVLQVEVRGFRQKTSNTYEVTTSEVYDIKQQDGSTQTKAFESAYLLTAKNGELQVYQLEETKEIQQ
ncbi:zinc ribbon domain-containing protein [Paenibacillus lemnae]|uniref:Zinc ribbon domain-containing protein n=1 Tax=Paenibacillus lemnae TaxID=1330551 RepID=A0A848MB56_PAELE|nr:hypothetical protein [Paenibacillus lemnae]NMO97905.1 hypothetical protein [Paenibacillus lemnae]